MLNSLSKLPYDETGQSLNNLVIQEYHTLERRKVRVIVPKHAPVFRKSVRIFDRNTGEPIRPELGHWLPYSIDPELTIKTKQEVVTALLILDERVGDQVELRYQAVGGPYTNLQTPIIEALKALAEDNRPVDWVTGVTNKPRSAVAGPHQHPAHHLVNLGALNESLANLTQNLLRKDRNEAQLLQDLFDDRFEQIDGDLNQLQQTITDLLADHQADRYLSQADMNNITQWIENYVDWATQYYTGDGTGTPPTPPPLTATGG